MPSSLSRRDVLVRATGCAGALGIASLAASAHALSAPSATDDLEPFGYCLNTGTIRGQQLSIPEQIRVAAEAGYQGIEPWTRDLKEHKDAGGSLADVRRLLEDSGVTVESAIGFARWIVDDDDARAEGLAQLREEMALLAEIGGKRIAAPPAGGNRQRMENYLDMADRYRVVLEMGREMGIVPQLEVWGASATMNRLGEAAMVAVEAAHPDACLLLDAYHLYKGGNDFGGLKLLNGAAMHVFHVNDYPADPPRETIGDADRVYPGDGVCPLDDVLGTLYDTGFRGMLSLELFNRTYWEQDTLVVAKTGLEKTRAVVRHAMAKR